MSRVKSSSAYSRSHAFRRYNLSAGYMVFYALMLTAVTVGITQVLASTKLSFGVVAPEFLYSTSPGLVYIYNITALAAFTVTTIAFPSYVRLSELRDNRWYMLSRMGIPPSTLVLGRMEAAFVGVLRTYILGFALTLGISLLVTGFSLSGLGTVVLSILAGVLVVILVLSPLFLISSLIAGRLILSLGALLMSALACLLMYLCGYFAPDSYEAVAAATRKLVSLNPTGLLLCAVIIGGACIAGALAACSKRCGAYNIEELDADSLISLDVRPELLILERGSQGYNVAISGSDVNNTGIDIPIPDMAEASWLDTHKGPTLEAVEESLSELRDKHFDGFSPDVREL